MHQATAADSLRLMELRQHAKEDEEYTQLQDKGFPSYCQSYVSNIGNFDTTPQLMRNS